jgi:hypothetical protein
MTTNTLIDQAMHNLQVVSEHAGAAPEPHNVRIEMRRLVRAVGTPLVRAVLEARMACKRLKDQLTAAQKEISDGRAYHDKQAREIFELNQRVCTMRQNARGNAVIVRRDGFSKPMNIATCGSFYGAADLPRYMQMHDMPEPDYGVRSACAKFDKASVAYRTLDFRNTGRQDGFGRTIFEEV